MNNWKGWILPGLVTVVLLTALSTYFKIEVIEASLTSKTSQTLASDYPWASLSADGRDITVGGISPSPTAKAAAVELAKTVYGVRIAKDGAELLELVSPYPFSAVKNNGTVSLSGNVLNSGMRAAVVAMAEKTNPDTNIADELTEARGNPDGFEGKVGFALQQLSLLRDGTVKLSDSQLSLSGTATSLDAYEALIDNLESALPDGVETASIELLPPVVSPYVWQANMSDGKIVLDGFAPSTDASDGIVDAFKTALPGVEINNKLRIAAGAAENFKSATDYAISFFPNFASGMASLEDSKLTISGTSRGGDAFQNALALVNQVPQGIELANSDILPKPADNFSWSLTKDGEMITVEGLAGDQQAADAIIAMVKQATGAPVVNDQQTFASGEPDSFQKAREFAAGQVKLLDTGTAKIDGNQIDISGTVKDAETLGLLERAMNLRVPAGYESVLDVSTPDSVVIKGKEVKLDNSAANDEPEVTPQQICQNDMVASIDGRKIQFESGKAVIKQGSITILDSVLIAVERSCEQFPIEIGGHTDSDGGEAFNQKLSEARAASVAKYLLSKGMDEGRLSIVGFGEAQPIADNGTREGKAINRRIEFKVLN